MEEFIEKNVPIEINGKEMIEINGKQIEVDKNCAEMVLFFNEIGLKTTLCCEGHKKPLYRIWFDVEDNLMEEFIKKIGTWVSLSVRPTNEEETEFEIYELRKGLWGWIYKRHSSYNEEYQTGWVYQSEALTNENAIRFAKKDLAIMKAVYFGTDLKKLQAEQKLIAQRNLENILKRQNKEDL